MFCAAVEGLLAIATVRIGSGPDQGDGKKERRRIWPRGRIRSVVVERRRARVSIKGSIYPVLPRNPRLQRLTPRAASRAESFQTTVPNLGASQTGTGMRTASGTADDPRVTSTGEEKERRGGGSRTAAHRQAWNGMARAFSASRAALVSLILRSLEPSLIQSQLRRSVDECRGLGGWVLLRIF